MSRARLEGRVAWLATAWAAAITLGYFAGHLEPYRRALRAMLGW